MIEAHIVADSISPTGNRLTSFGITAHRFILAEINTHKRLSRSYRSSRAVPVKKLLEEVRTNPAMPVYWGANQPGMQASGEISDVKDGIDIEGVYTVAVLDSHDEPSRDSSPLERAQYNWNNAAKSAAYTAETLAATGLHKQIANRVLEPFLWVNGIITATEWDNFFGLRLHKAAQPEFRALADAMWVAMKASTPVPLEPGEWHLPYIDEDDQETICSKFVNLENGAYDFDKAMDLCRKISVARCARSSYQSFDTGARSTVEENLSTYAKLNIPGTDNYDPTQPIHASPAEHQATPDVNLPIRMVDDNLTDGGWKYPDQHANFVGFRQYRKMLPGEDVAPLPEGYR